MKENEISEKLFSLIKNNIKWMKDKLENNEPFSALLLTFHPDGLKSTKYGFDTIFKSYLEFKYDLFKNLKDTEKYVFGFNALVKIENKKQKVFVLRIEETGIICAFELFQKYNFENSNKNIKNSVELIEDINLLASVRPLLRDISG
ncbi:MAG: hypothetical protein ACRENO_01750 [Thermodesulfobacteriota bacterium]